MPFSFASVKLAKDKKQSQLAELSNFMIICNDENILKSFKYHQKLFLFIDATTLIVQDLHKHGLMYIEEIKNFNLADDNNKITTYATRIAFRPRGIDNFEEFFRTRIASGMFRKSNIYRLPRESSISLFSLKNWIDHNYAAIHKKIFLQDVYVNRNFDVYFIPRNFFH